VLGGQRVITRAHRCALVMVLDMLTPETIPELEPPPGSAGLPAKARLTVEAKGPLNP
jgi:hypothetical protein